MFFNIKSKIYNEKYFKLKPYTSFLVMWVQKTLFDFLDEKEDIKEMPKLQ